MLFITLYPLKLPNLILIRISNEYMSVHAYILYALTVMFYYFLRLFLGIFAFYLIVDSRDTDRKHREIESGMILSGLISSVVINQ